MTFLRFAGRRVNEEWEARKSSLVIWIFVEIKSEAEALGTRRGLSERNPRREVSQDSN